MLGWLNFKGYDFFPHGTHIDFMRWRDVCFGVSVIMMLGSLGLFFVKGLNYGVDFTGGTVIEMQTKDGSAADIGGLLNKLKGLGLGDIQMQAFGSPSDVLIRVEQQKGGDAAQQVAASKIAEAMGSGFTMRRTEIVGPAVSNELKFTGIMALVGAMIAIVAYVWFRFEWQFAFGTIMALVHDVLLTVGLFSLFWLEFDLSIVAALLTILGYSVNDTVVISDRIREDLRKYKRMNLSDLLNLSINETLSRTILTGTTTFAVLIALFVFGGPVIHNFTLAMLFGIAVGTYSSIFISAPVLGYLGIRRETVGDAPKPEATVAGRRPAAARKR